MTIVRVILLSLKFKYSEISHLSGLNPGKYCKIFIDGMGPTCLEKARGSLAAG